MTIFKLNKWHFIPSGLRKKAREGFSPSLEHEEQNLYKLMEHLPGDKEPSLIDGGKDTGTPTAVEQWEIKKTKLK